MGTLRTATLSYPVSVLTDVSESDQSSNLSSLGVEQWRVWWGKGAAEFLSPTCRMRHRHVCVVISDPVHVGVSTECGNLHSADWIAQICKNKTHFPGGD